MSDAETTRATNRRLVVLMGGMTVITVASVTALAVVLLNRPTRQPVELPAPVYLVQPPEEGASPSTAPAS